MTDSLIKTFKISNKLIESGFFDDQALDAMESCGIIQPGTYVRPDRDNVSKEYLTELLRDLDSEDFEEVKETLLDLASIKRLAKVTLLTSNTRKNVSLFVDLQGNYIMPENGLELSPGDKILDHKSGSFSVRYVSGVYLNGKKIASRAEVIDADD